MAAFLADTIVRTTAIAGLAGLVAPASASALALAPPLLDIDGLIMDWEGGFEFNTTTAVGAPLLHYSTDVHTTF